MNIPEDLCLHRSGQWGEELGEPPARLGDPNQVDPARSWALWGGEDQSTLGIQLLTRNHTKLCSHYTWDASNQNNITLSRTPGPGRGFQPEAGVDEQNRHQDRKNPHLG